MIVVKVCEPYVITTLDQTPTFEWLHCKACSEGWPKLSFHEHNWEGLCGRLKREFSLCTLISSASLVRIGNLKVFHNQ